MMSILRVLVKKLKKVTMYKKYRNCYIDKNNNLNIFKVNCSL